MKPFLLVFFCSSIAWAGSGDYNVNIHVTATHMRREHGDAARRQQLDVIIDGKKLQLESESIPNALLSLGDYKAKQVKQRPLAWRHLRFLRGLRGVAARQTHKTIHCSRPVRITAVCPLAVTSEN